jgi:radical SAM superfamily enzyme YgiQ (UPF0313 family)
MKPRVLLIDTPPNVADRHAPPRTYLPLGPLFLATALRRHDVPVTLYDPKLSAAVFPHEGLWAVGDSFDAIEDRIRAAAPALVGVSSLLSKDANNALAVCRRARRAAPEALVVVGGPAPTAAPEDFLAAPEVDAVVLGEGEETILDLVAHVEEGRPLATVPGVAYREGDAVCTNPPRPHRADLDGLGFPDYGLAPMETYFRLYATGRGPRPLQEGRRTLPLVTSRGCPFGCTFCAARGVMGGRWRAYSAEAILGHLRDAVRAYRIDSVQFEDDNLTFDRARFEAILDGLLALPRRLRWSTPNGVRAETLLDEALLRAVKRSGCTGLTIGVESGNQDVLNRVVHKGLRLDDVAALAALCRRVRLPLHAFYIIGFPGETEREIRDTLDFAFGLYRDHGVYPFVNFAIPLKGTAMYDTCVERGYLTAPVTPARLTQSASFRGEGMICTEAFTPEQLAAWMGAFNRRVFRATLRRLLGDPPAALRMARLAVRNLAHFKWYVLGH